MLIWNGTWAKIIKFQNMTSLVDKICANKQTSAGYLLNWVLASTCSFSRKSWILFTVSVCTAAVDSFQSPIWKAVILLLTATSFYACVQVKYDNLKSHLTQICVPLSMLKQCSKIFFYLRVSNYQLISSPSGYKFC